MVPPRTLFNFRLFLAPLPQPHRPDGSLDAFGPQHRLPELGPMDKERVFAHWFVGWRPEGLSVGLRVLGWDGDFEIDAKRYWQSDGLRVFVDTRDTKDAQRAGRFCQQFYILPRGGGSDGDLPLVGRARVQRAKEEPPPVNTQLIKVAVQTARREYRLEAFLPAEVLPGYEPAQFNRLGLFLTVTDHHLGEQNLTCGDELEFWANPSSWASCELMTG